MTIHWGRVIGGAILVELILFAVLVPLGAVNQTLFLATVPVAAFVVGYLVTWGAFRNNRSDLWVNAALLGCFATAIYLAIVLASSGIGAAIAIYGLMLFAVANTMRVAGCLAAALQLQRGSRRGGAEGKTSERR